MSIHLFWIAETVVARIKFLEIIKMMNHALSYLSVWGIPKSP